MLTIGSYPMHIETGCRLEAVTIRKLNAENDPSCI